MKNLFLKITFTTMSVIILMTPLFIFAAPNQNIIDGDLVKTIDNPDVYIVKLVGVKKFKRLILNPEIFNSYGHLRWDKIKIIDQVTIDTFSPSELVIEVNADGSVADPKVYKVTAAPNSDTGERRWLNLTASEFEVAGFDWDSLYYVNHKEASPSFYPTKEAYTYQAILQEKKGQTASVKSSESFTLPGPPPYLFPW